jgi:hypothetical protein
MRGGRSQPKEVSRSTYHAHAPLRVASYEDFVSQQAHLQPNNLNSGVSDMGNRARSLSPASTSHANKRRRHDLLSEDTGIMGQPGGPGEAEENVVGENIYPDRPVSTSNYQFRHIFFQFNIKIKLILIILTA